MNFLLIIYVALGCVQLGHKHSEHELFNELGLMEPIKYILPPGLSKAYLIHFFGIIVALFVINGLAVFKVRNKEKLKISYQDAQSTKMKMSSIVCDRNPFIVFEKQPSENADSIRADSEINQDTVVFQVSFVSDTCKKEIVPLMEPRQIEQCLVKEISATIV